MSAPRALRALALASLASAAAWPAGAALGPLYGGELRVAVPDLPRSLDPTGGETLGARLATTLVHETLLDVSADGAPRPRLAEGWSAGVHGPEWTLRLDPHARFHDDSLVSTSDAVRSLRRFLRASTPAATVLAAVLDGGDAFASGASEELPGVAAPDDRAIVLRVRDSGRAAVPLLALASPAAGVVSRSGAAAGPFVPTIFAPGQRVTATPAATHVRGRPFVDVLRVAVVADGPRAARELRRDLWDVVAGHGHEDTRPDAPPGPLLLLVLDASRPPFADSAGRARVDAAIDPAALARLLAGARPAHTLLSGSDDPRSEAPEALGPGATPADRSIVLEVGPGVPPLASQRIVAHLGTLGFRVVARPSSAGPRPHVRLVAFLPEVAHPLLALHEMAWRFESRDEGARALLTALSPGAADPVRELARRLRERRVVIPLIHLADPLASGPRVRGVGRDGAGIPRLEDAWLLP